MLEHPSALDYPYGGPDPLQGSDVVSRQARVAWRAVAAVAFAAFARAEMERLDLKAFVEVELGAFCFVDAGDIVGMRACAAPVAQLVVAVVAAVAVAAVAVVVD